MADAKSADSPLHLHFTWDLDEAAQAHWLDQARRLITSVMVTVHTQETTVKSVFYVRDPSAGKQQGYVSVTSLRSDEDMAREALVNEFTRVADLLRRARSLAVALDAGNDVDSLIQSVVGLRSRFTESSAFQ